MSDCGIKVNNEFIKKTLGLTEDKIFTDITELTNALNEYASDKWLKTGTLAPVKVTFDSNSFMLKDESENLYELSGEWVSELNEELSTSDIDKLSITEDELLEQTIANDSKGGGLVSPVKIALISTSSLEADEENIVIQSTQAVTQRNILKKLYSISGEEQSRYNLIYLQDREEFYHDDEANFNEETKGNIAILVKDFEAKVGMTTTDILTFVPDLGKEPDSNKVFPISIETTKEDELLEGTSFYHRNNGNAQEERLKILQRDHGMSKEEAEQFYQDSFKTLYTQRRKIKDTKDFTILDIDNISRGVLGVGKADWPIDIFTQNFSVDNSRVLTDGNVYFSFNDSMTNEKVSIPAIPKVLGKEEKEFLINRITDLEKVLANTTQYNKLQEGQERLIQAAINTLSVYMAYYFGARKKGVPNTFSINKFKGEQVYIRYYNADNKMTLNVNYNSKSTITKLKENVGLLRNMFENEDLNLYRNLGLNLVFKSNLDNTIQSTLNNIAQKDLNLGVEEYSTKRFKSFITGTLNLTGANTTTVKKYLQKFTYSPYSPHTYRDDLGKEKKTFERLSRYIEFNFGENFSPSNEISATSSLHEEFSAYINQLAETEGVEEFDADVDTAKPNWLPEEDYGRWGAAIPGNIWLNIPNKDISNREEIKKRRRLEENLHALSLDWLKTNIPKTSKGEVSLDVKKYPTELKAVITTLKHLKKLQKDGNTAFLTDNWIKTIGNSGEKIREIHLVELLGRGPSMEQFIKDLTNITIDKNQTLLDKLLAVIDAILIKVFKKANIKALPANTYRDLVLSNIAIVQNYKNTKAVEEKEESNKDMDFGDFNIAFSLEDSSLSNNAIEGISQKEKSNILDVLYISFITSQFPYEEIQSLLLKGIPENHASLKNFPKLINYLKANPEKTNGGFGIKFLEKQDIDTWIESSKKFKFGLTEENDKTDIEEVVELTEDEQFAKYDDAINDLIEQFDEKGNKGSSVDRISKTTSRIISFLPRVRKTENGLTLVKSDKTGFTDPSIISESISLLLQEFAVLSERQAIQKLIDTVQDSSNNIVTVDNVTGKVSRTDMARPDYTMLIKILGITPNSQTELNYDPTNPVLRDFLTNLTGFSKFPVHTQAIKVKYDKETKSFYTASVTTHEETGHSDNQVKEVFNSGFRFKQFAEIDRAKKDENYEPNFEQDERTKNLVPTQKFIDKIVSLGTKIDSLSKKIKIAGRKNAAEVETLTDERTETIKNLLAEFGIEFKHLTTDPTSLYLNYESTVKLRLFGGSIQLPGKKAPIVFKGYNGYSSNIYDTHPLLNVWDIFNTRSLRPLLRKEAIFREFMFSSVVKVDGKAISQFSLPNTVLMNESLLNEFNLERLKRGDYAVNSKEQLAKEMLRNFSDTRLKYSMLNEFISSEDNDTKASLKVRNLQRLNYTKVNDTSKGNTSDLTNFFWNQQQYHFWEQENMVEFIRTETSSTAWAWRLEKESGTSVRWVETPNDFDERMKELLFGAIENMIEIKNHPEYQSMKDAFGSYKFFSPFGFLNVPNSEVTTKTLNELTLPEGVEIGSEQYEDFLETQWESISTQVRKERQRIIDDVRTEFNKFGANIPYKDGDLNLELFALNYKIHQVYSVHIFYGGYTWFQKFFKRSKLPVSTGTKTSDDPNFYKAISKKMAMVYDESDETRISANPYFRVLAVDDVLLQYDDNKHQLLEDNAKKSLEASLASTNTPQAKFDSIWNGIKSALLDYKGGANRKGDGVNITDGQSWTSLDLIRIMMKSRNLWKDKQENLYNYEVAFLKTLRYAKARNLNELYNALKTRKIIITEMFFQTEDDITEVTLPISDVELELLNKKPKGTFTSHKWQYQGLMKTGNSFIDRINPVTSLKTSFPALLPSTTIGTAFEDLLDVMYGNDIDVIATDGAVKGKNKAKPNYKEVDGKQIVDYDNLRPTQVLPLYDTNSEGNFTLNKDILSKSNIKDASYQLYTPMLKEQLKSSFKTKLKNLLATQFRKLLFSGTKVSYYDKNGKFTHNDWMNENIKDAYSQFNTALAELSDIEKQQLSVDLGIDFDNNTIIDKSILIEGIIRELESRPDDPDSSLIRLLYHLKNEEGEVSFFDFTQATQILGDFVSGIINKRIARVKLHGNALILKTSVGTEVDLSKLSAEDREKIMTKYSQGGEHYSPLAGGLRFYEYTEGDKQVRSAEALLSISQGNFSNLLNRKDVKELHRAEGISTLAALNKLMENDEWYEANIDLFTVFGYRIPTSGLNLMDVYRIKQFLPEEDGNIIIVPAEATIKAGEDFDIDKKNFYFPSYGDDGNLISDVKAEEFLEKKVNTAKANLYKQIKKLEGVKALDLMFNLNGKLELFLEDNLDNQLATVDDFFSGMLMENERRAIEIHKEKFAEYVKRLQDFTKYREHKKKFVTNKLIAASAKATLDPARYYQLILPVSTEFLSQESAAYKMYDSDKMDTHKITDFSTSAKKRYDMVLYGQKLTGLAATGTTMFEMFSKYGLKINLDWDGGQFSGIQLPLLTKEEISSITQTSGGKRYLNISNLVSFDNVLKSDVYNQFTQATIDAASDSLLAPLNVTDDTLPVILYLMEIGIPLKRIFAFITQPVIQERQKLLGQNIRSSEANVMILRDTIAPLSEEYSSFVVTSKQGNDFINWTDVKSYLSDKGLFEFDNVRIDKSNNSKALQNKNFSTFVNTDNADLQLLYFYLHNSYLGQSREYLKNKQLVNHDTNPDRNPVTAQKRINLKEQLEERDALGNGLMPISIVNSIIEDSEISHYYQPELIRNIGQVVTPLRSNKTLVSESIRLENQLVSLNRAPLQKKEKFRRLFINDWVDWVLKTQYTMPSGTSVRGKDYSGKTFNEFYENSAEFIFNDLQDRINKYNLIELRDYLYQGRPNKLWQQISIRSFVRDEKLQDVIRQDLTKLKDKDEVFYNRLMFTIQGQNGFNRRFDSWADMFEQVDLYESIKQQLSNFIAKLSDNPAFEKRMVSDYTVAWLNHYTERMGKVQPVIDFSGSDLAREDIAKFLPSDIEQAFNGDKFAPFALTADSDLNLDNINDVSIKDKKKTVGATDLIAFPNKVQLRPSSTLRYKVAAEIQGFPVNSGVYNNNTVAMVSVQGGKKYHVTDENVQHTVNEISKVLDAGGQVRMDIKATRESKWNRYGEAKVARALFEKYGTKLSNNVSGLNLNFFVQFKLVEETTIPNEHIKKEILREKIQPGFINYGTLSSNEINTITSLAIQRGEEQAYHVKKDVAYGHWGLMWGVNDKGNDAFPIFGKHLKKSDVKTGLGKNLPQIDLPAAPINQASRNQWYEYYTTDQNGNPLPKIPKEVLDIIQSHTGIDMSIYDSAIINYYGENRILSRHIDNTEDKSAGRIPIVSISLLNDGSFMYSDPNSNPNNMSIPDKNTANLKVGQVVAFGGPSRYMPHRVQVGSSGVNTPVNTTTGNIAVNRINITLRRAKAVTDIEYNAWKEATKKLQSTPSKEENIKKEIEVKPSFTYEGHTIDTEFPLSEDQEKALKDLIEFIQKGGSENIITLQGAAGTGKTSIIGYLQKYLGESFMYTAPTHAATVQLAFSTWKTGNTTFPATVRSSIYYKFDPKTKQRQAMLTKKGKAKLGFGRVIVVDEASLVNSEDLQMVEDLANRVGYKVIYLGDKKQLPEVIASNPNAKNVSKAFTAYRTINLDKIHRTSNNWMKAVLQKVRDSIKFKMYKPSENSESLKFTTNQLEFNQSFLKDLKQDPEGVVYIGYTNKSVESYNDAIRRELGKGPNIEVGDVITGYLGYQSKQVEKGDLANAVNFTLSGIENLNGKFALTLTSKKLQNLKEEGFNELQEEHTTVYYPLTSNDRIKTEVTESQREMNNVYVSSILAKVHDAFSTYLQTKNGTDYQTYLSLLEETSDLFRKIDLGSTYVYNPDSNKMEFYNKSKPSEAHRKLKKKLGGSAFSTLTVEKGLDYGHAITIHKSQGTTIDKVYFDANTFNSRDIDILENGKPIYTERQALAYVAMSRASKKLVVFEGKHNFETVDVSNISEDLNSVDSTVNPLEARRSKKVQNAIVQITEKLKVLEGKSFIVDPTSSNYYVETDTAGNIIPGTRRHRITSLTDEDGSFATKRDNPSKEGQSFRKLLERAASRGTIVDIALRDFVLKPDMTEREFIQQVQQIEAFERQQSIKNDTEPSFKFNEEAMKDLYKIFNDFLAAHPHLVFISNSRTLWGTIEGKKYAGTMDLIAYNTRTGREEIFDLKTSTRDRRVREDSLFQNYRFKDSIQQAGYSELYRQRMEAIPAAIRIFDLKVRENTETKQLERVLSGKQLEQERRIESTSEFVDKTKEAQFTINLVPDIASSSFTEDIRYSLIDYIFNTLDSNNITEYTELQKIDPGVENIKNSFLYRTAVKQLTAPLANFIFSANNGTASITISDVLKIRAKLEKEYPNLLHKPIAYQEALDSNQKLALLQGVEHIVINTDDKLLKDSLLGAHNLDEDYQVIIYEEGLDMRSKEVKPNFLDMRSRNESGTALSVTKLPRANALEQAFPSLTYKLEDVSTQEEVMFKAIFEDLTRPEATREIGFVEFSLNEDSQIDVSFVSSYFKRQGYATRMYQVLSNEFGVPIKMPSQVTKEEQQFHDSFILTDNEITKIKNCK